MFILFRFFFYLLRFFYKGFLRRITGKCQLLRLTLGTSNQITLTNKIENSMRRSRHRLLYQALDEPPANIDLYIFSVIALKKIKIEQRRGFKFTFGACLNRLMCLRQMKRTVEEMRLTMFDEFNKAHYNICLQVFRTFDDAMTTNLDYVKTFETIEDFKAELKTQNILMISCLQYYITNFKSMAKNIYIESTSVEKGYDFFNVASDLSKTLSDALLSNTLNSYFYYSDNTNIKDFYRLFVQCLSKYRIFWMEKGFSRSEQEAADKSFYDELKSKINQSNSNGSVIIWKL